MVLLHLCEGSFTLSPIIMEVETGGLEDDFSLQGYHFPLNHDYGKGTSLSFYEKSRRDFSLFERKQLLGNCQKNTSVIVG